MNYDPESDTYTCKNGRRLNADHTSKKELLLHDFSTVNATAPPPQGA